jgi:hypothetical protein
MTENERWPEFTVTVHELREYLKDKQGNAKVVITPIHGESFALMGWCETADKQTVIFTGGNEDA